MTTTGVILFVVQGIIGMIFTVGTTIVVAKISAVHKLVNSRSEAQDTKISLLTAQLAAQGLLLTAAETARHSGGNS
jgi:hypothetical protein